MNDDEHSTRGSRKLESAHRHLDAAVEDVKAFIDEELPDLTDKGMRIAQSVVTSGAEATQQFLRSLIEQVEQIKTNTDRQTRTDNQEEKE